MIARVTSGVQKFVAMKAVKANMKVETSAEVKTKAATMKVPVQTILSIQNNFLKNPEICLDLICEKSNPFEQHFGFSIGFRNHLLTK